MAHPLKAAPRLARALGLGGDDLWIKRDDLTGLGGGGNKVRKLEWLCGAALAAGADTLVTCGAAPSNHARLTAAAGVRLGLDVVLVLAGPAAAGGGGNVALDGLLGATVVWAGSTPHEDLEEIAEGVRGDLAARGARVVLIPYGGSNVTGARGYVNCGHELLAQAPELATVVTAVGSGGTMAGLVSALGPDRVLGVDGYGELTEAVMDALLLAARTEGLLLDPIYTGRALAGLRRAVAEGQVVAGAPTVFLRSGGLPGFFGHPATVARAETVRPAVATRPT